MKLTAEIIISDDRKEESMAKVKDGLFLLQRKAEVTITVHSRMPEADRAEALIVALYKVLQRHDGCSLYGIPDAAVLHQAKKFIDANNLTTH